MAITLNSLNFSITASIKSLIPVYINAYRGTIELVFWCNCYFVIISLQCVGPRFYWYRNESILCDRERCHDISTSTINSSYNYITPISMCTRNIQIIVSIPLVQPISNKFRIMLLKQLVFPTLGIPKRCLRLYFQLRLSLLHEEL